MQAGDPSLISDHDAFDRLPLSVIPLSSARLRSSRLIKNEHLETTLELYSSPETGSMQIRPHDVASMFPGNHDDEEIILQLAALPSYDVYSLRPALKALGIAVDTAHLELTEGMKKRLDEYAHEFTLPLITNIFGSDSHADHGELMKMFHDPNVARVHARLQLMSQKTGIPVEDIPAFLREYRDIFLSTAYYRHSFENILPEFSRCAHWLATLKTHRDVTASPLTMGSCQKVMESLRYLSASAHERLNRFGTAFEMFWSDMSQESFRRLSNQIAENHTGTGAVLCGLMVKVRNWSHKFPDDNAGGPVTRIKYVMTEMESGLERLVAAEREARQHIGSLPTH